VVPLYNVLWSYDGCWIALEIIDVHLGLGMEVCLCGYCFLILLGVVIYFIVKTQIKNLEGQSRETPIDILKKRYAKGEITKKTLIG